MAEELDMKEDDNEMVNEILAELSDEKPKTPKVYDPTPPPLPPPVLNEPISTKDKTDVFNHIRSPEPLAFDPSANQYDSDDYDSVEEEKNVIKKKKNTTKPEKKIPDKVTVGMKSYSELLQITNRIKKPIIVTIIAFILFNPIIRKFLASKIPYLFGYEVTYWGHQLRILLLSMLLGLIFLSINLII